MQNANNTTAGNTNTGKCEEIAGKENTMATWKKTHVGIYDGYTNGTHTVLKKGMKNWEIRYNGIDFSFPTLKEAKMLAESGTAVMSIDEATDAIAKAKTQKAMEEAQAKEDAKNLDREATVVAKDLIAEINANVPRVFVEIPQDEVVKEAIAKALEEVSHEDVRRGHNRRVLAAARKKAEDALAKYREVCGTEEIGDVLEDENATAERRMAFREVQAARKKLDELEVECAEVADKVFEGETVYVVSRLMSDEDYDYTVRAKAFNAWDETIAKAKAPSKLQKEVLRCLRTEMKDARNKAKETEGTYFTYSLGIALNEARPTSALVPAYKVVDRVNEILFGDNACGVKRNYVNYNVSDPNLLHSASRAIAKKVVDNATERQCTPTQLGMYYAARTADWEQPDLSDMVSSAASGLAYAIAPRELVNNTREMAKLLIDVGGKLAEVAPKDRLARQEIVSLLDVDGAIARAFNIKYNRLCDASAKVMSLEADYRRVKAYADNLFDKSWKIDTTPVDKAQREYDEALERRDIEVSKAINRAVDTSPEVLKAQAEVEKLRAEEHKSAQAYNKAHKALVEQATKTAYAKEAEMLAEWVKDSRAYSRQALDEYNDAMIEFRKACVVLNRNAKYAEAVEVFTTPFMDVPRTKEMSDEDKARLDEYAALLFEAEEMHAQAKAKVVEAHDNVVRKRKNARLACLEYRDYRDRASAITTKAVFVKDDENAKALWYKMRANMRERKKAAKNLSEVKMTVRAQVLELAQNTADVIELRDKLNELRDARDEANKLVEQIKASIHEKLAVVNCEKRNYHEFKANDGTALEMYTRAFEVADRLFDAKATLNKAAEDYGDARKKYTKASKAYASATTPPDEENGLCLAQKLSVAEREAVTRYYTTHDDHAKQANKELGKTRKALALAKMQAKQDRESAIAKAKALPEVLSAYDDARYVKHAVDDAIADADKARREYNAIAKSAKLEIAQYSSYDGELMVKRGKLLLEVIDAVDEVDNADAPYYKAMANREMIIAGFHFVNNYLASQRSVRDDCKYGTLSIEELDRYIEDPRVYAENEASEYEIRRRKYIRAAWKSFFDALTPTQVSVVKALDKCVTETDMDGKITRVAKMLKRSKVTIHEHIVAITKVFAQALKSVAPDSIELASANLVALASEKSAIECKRELELTKARAKCKDAKDEEKKHAEDAVKMLENVCDDAKIAMVIRKAIADVFEHQLSPVMAECAMMIRDGMGIRAIAREKGKSAPTVIESRNRACDLFADAIRQALAKPDYNAEFRALLVAHKVFENVEALRVAHDLRGLLALAA